MRWTVVTAARSGDTRDRVHRERGKGKAGQPAVKIAFALLLLAALGIAALLAAVVQPVLDTPDTLDYRRMARIAEGIAAWASAFAP
jgi:hypothetical protein